MAQRIEWKLWLTGVLMLITLIVLGATVMGDSQFSITDHQSAGTAERVNEIQTAWQSEGYFGMHIFGMFADLAFIIVYSFGAWRAGKGMNAQSRRFVSTLGWVVMICALTFFVTDMTETSLQLVQMLMEQGIDWMAATAAFAQPIKSVTFILSFFGVFVGLISVRTARPL